MTIKFLRKFLPVKHSSISSFLELRDGSKGDKDVKQIIKGLSTTERSSLTLDQQTLPATYVFWNCTPSSVQVMFREKSMKIQNWRPRASIKRLEGREDNSGFRQIIELIEFLRCYFLGSNDYQINRKTNEKIEIEEMSDVTYVMRH